MGRPQGGVVVDHGYGPRIKVRNAITRATYWIHAPDIVEPGERDDG